MKKVVIIGIDSATLDIILPMVREGRLPNMASLMEEGAWGELRSTTPPVTPPAWVSFMTGKNPGKHGVFDFYVPPTYGYVRPILNSKYIKAKTLWRILSDLGYRVGVINLPMTHPPEEIKGFIIPGVQYSFDGKAFTHPPGLMDEIQGRFGEYRVLYGDLESLYTNDLDKFLSEWRQIFEVRRKTMLYLMENKDWDVFMPVFYSVDVMQHHFWKFFDPSHPLHDKALASKYGGIIPEFYEKIDSVMGEILGRAPKDTTVIVLSDHGAGTEEEGFSVNNWLASEGFLSFRKSFEPLRRFRWPHVLYKALRRLRFPGIGWTVPMDKLRALGRVVDPREGLNVAAFINWDRTLAYGGNHTEQGIYINLKGREPGGIVEKGEEYEALRTRIMERLREVIDPSTGRRLEVDICRKEDVYNGPYVDDAPDIFVFMKDGKCLMQKEIHHRGFFHRAYKSSGTHRPEGMFILKGRGIRPGQRIEDARIVDIAPTLLYMMGLSVPEDMDGEVLNRAFTEEYRKSHAMVRGPSAERLTARGEGVLDGEESEKVKKALRDLGYFG